MGNRYNNYHKHTHYSNLRTLDCISKPLDYIKRAKELGHTTYFTTEHGFQGNIFEAFTLCQENDLKCIYGVEAYYVDDMMNRSERNNYHIILIAMTENARKEINKIMSKANTDGYYYKPRIDLDAILSLTPDETIITTACVAGRMFKNDYIEKFLLPVKKHFKNNLYLEVQSHIDTYQAQYNKMIIECSKRYDIKIIHANDSHYINKDDAKYRDLFLKAKGIVYEDEGNFILDYPTYEEIVDRYRKQGILTDEQIYEALDNTLIFDKSTGIYIDKEFKIPKVTEGDSNKVLGDILNNAWKKKKTNVKEKDIKRYLEGIKYEYDIIKNCHMADYFILDNKIVDRAVNVYNAILTRSGRGSAVSFFNNNLLGLTEVDRFKSPITLYPTRFMSAERILSSRSLPDIDLNFSDVTPVIQASKDILGEDGIYYMIAYKPLQESSAFRLWCKANDMHIDEYNEIAKDLDSYVNDKKWGTIIEDSKVFRGVIESVAPSPCSFLLMDKPISEEIGLIKVGNEICCCLDGYNCDVYKYLKNDYLTVQVYTLIDEVYKLIGRPIDDISTLVNNCNESVWKLFSEGITTTVNQCDSDFGKQILKRYKPNNLSELSAYVAAIRPGFASQLNDFIDRKPYTTGVKELDELLSDSFGRMIYQESIMKYLVWLGIEEKGTYDIIKKIAKKKFKQEELDALKNKLLKGWINNVGEEDGFNDTWQIVEDAARYSFNASHSLSVAIDALYGAYLKANYPIEYMTVALNLYSGDEERTNNLVKECDYFNISIKNPVFRKSKGEYFFDKDTNSIYKGIGSIKYMNNTVGDELYELRYNKYDSFVELLKDIKSTSCNSRQLDILIKIGFFNEFGSIKKLLEVVEVFNTYYSKKTISKDKIALLGLEHINLNKYATDRSEKTGKEQKTWKLLDVVGLINELSLSISDEEYDITQLLQWQNEILGYIGYTNSKLDKRYAFVQKIDGIKGTRKVNLYCLNNGKTSDFKVNSRLFSSKPFKEGDIIYTASCSKKYKAIPIEKDENNKVTKWGKDMNTIEWWLDDYNNKLN